MRTGLVTVQALPGQTDEAAKNAEEIAWRPATSQMINKSRGAARLLTGSEFLHIRYRYISSSQSRLRFRAEVPIGHTVGTVPYSFYKGSNL